jgi:hypothetical protein
MRIIDGRTNKPLKDISLFLTPMEARQLIADLEGLLTVYGEQGRHEHLSDDDYKYEITTALYDDKDLNKFKFNEIAMKLLRDEL